MFRKIGLVVMALVLVSGAGALHAAKKDGLHKTYYDSGELKFESMYKDGELNGVTKEYTKAGALKAKYVFKNGTVVSKREVARTPRELGAMGFVRSWVFWVIVAGVLIVLGFAFSKIAFKNRPF